MTIGSGTLRLERALNFREQHEERQESDGDQDEAKNDSRKKFHIGATRHERFEDRRSCAKCEGAWLSSSGRINWRPKAENCPSIRNPRLRRAFLTQDI